MDSRAVIARPSPADAEVKTASSKPFWPTESQLVDDPAKRQSEKRSRAAAVGGRARNEKRKATNWTPTGQGVKRGW